MLGWARSGLPRTKRADRRLDGVGFGLPVMHAGLLGAGVKRPSVPQDARRCCPTPCPDCCPFFLGPGAASAVRSEKHGCATPRKRARATPWATLRATLRATLWVPPRGNGLALQAVILANISRQNSRQGLGQHRGRRAPRGNSPGWLARPRHQPGRLPPATSYGVCPVAARGGSDGRSHGRPGWAAAADALTRRRGDPTGTPAEPDSLADMMTATAGITTPPTRCSPSSPPCSLPVAHFARSP